MGKLTILGAQRVKALQEILDKQYKFELKKLEAHEPKDERSRAEIVVDRAEATLTDPAQILHHIQSDLRAIEQSGFNLSYQLRNILQHTYDYDDFYDSSLRDTPVDVSDYNAKVAELKTHFDELKNRLWLCETLEEAKQIVGLDEEESK